MTHLHVLLLQPDKFPLVLDELCGLSISIRVEARIRLVVVGVEEIKWLDDLRVDIFDTFGLYVSSHVFKRFYEGDNSMS